ESGLERLFSDVGHETAAVIIEPMPANHGLLPQRTAFLGCLRRLCTRHGVVLIFDEVISGFRVGFAGYAGLCGVIPDLVTWGKIIGGGFAVGAVGGQLELMQTLAPAGPVYQAGTLSANPVAMTAGLASLEQLADTTAYDQLETLGRSLDCALRDIPDVGLQRVGSVFWVMPGRQPDATVRRPDRIPQDAIANHANFFQAALARGIYLPPSPYEVGFLSLAHRPGHIDALGRVLAQLQARSVDSDSVAASSRRTSSRK
ncbi:MAG TPA: aminotransferase class III-fold pyridoxal phosphate-dependent enzyme, partial [Chromatiales bacterium]|nr:aminotransferase class III-fold pyridoxal phosphate-dependent enzyme [Chromatiales bacterium]